MARRRHYRRRRSHGKIADLLKKYTSAGRPKTTGAWGGVYPRGDPRWKSQFAIGIKGADLIKRTRRRNL